MKHKKKLLYDILGGALTSFLGLPKSIAFGLIIFMPLGPEYAAVGALSGLAAMGFSNSVTFFFKGGSIVNSGPYSLSALMLASAASTLVHTYHPVDVMTIIYLAVFISGMLQVLFSWMKLGVLAKYIPYPVLSGLLNGSGLIILSSQIRLTFQWNTLSDIYTRGISLSPELWVILVSIAITIVVYYGVKWKHIFVPPPIAAVTVGSILFFSLVRYLGLQADHLLVSSIKGGIPLPTSLLNIGHFFTDTGGTSLIVTTVIPLSVSMGLVNSLSSFISQSTSDSLLNERTDSNRELAGQGWGNIVSALFGGISSAGSTSRTSAAFEYRASTRVSKLAGGIFILLVMAVFAPLLSYIPKPVLTGILIILAFKLFDSWFFAQLKSYPSATGTRKKDILFSILTSLIVTVVMIAIGIVYAVGIGVVLSLIIFVNAMTRGIIRKEYSGRFFRSNTERPGNEVEFLETNGHRIVILELEGYLYFGTADYLILRINELLDEGTEILILEVHRLKNIDSSGIVTLRQIQKKCINLSRSFFIASVHRKSILHDYHEFTAILFRQLDDALAKAEDLIIKKSGEIEKNERLELKDLDILKGFSLHERNILQEFLVMKRFPAGEIIIMEGNRGDAVYFIIQGRAGLFVTLPDGRYKKFYRLSRGTLFGEMAMIDGNPRSADIIAETDMVCYQLTLEMLEELKMRRPEIAYKIMTGVAALLSRRIRINLSIISQLRQ